MKKLIAFAIIIAASFMFGYNYIMAKQIDPPKAVEMNTNNQSNNSGQTPVQDEVLPKDKVSPPAKTPDEEKQSTVKPVSPPVKQASKNSTSNKKSNKAGTINNTENKPNSKGYFVKVDISDQRTYVYKDGRLIRTMICSTGIEDENSRTPRGQYIINQTGYKKGEWFYSNKYQEGAKYWVGFIGGTYLFHSVPMDIDKNIIQSEADKLGTPASHGCVRLSVDDAYWFYNSIPAGAGLLVQN